MSHERKLVFVRNMALAFQASWRIPLPNERLIGGLRAAHAGDRIVLSVGSDRHHNLGGPLTSVRDHLRAYIRSSLDAFKQQQVISYINTSLTSTALFFFSLFSFRFLYLELLIL
jgi:hypothetical protein